MTMPESNSTFISKAQPFPFEKSYSNELNPLPYPKPGESELIVDPRKLIPENGLKPDYPDLLNIAPNGLIMFPKNGQSLAGFPVENPPGERMTNLPGMETQIGFYRLAGFKIMIEMDMVGVNITHVLVPSGVNQDDSRLEEKIDWAGPMKKFITDLNIPHLHLLNDKECPESIMSTNTWEEMAYLAKIMASSSLSPRRLRFFKRMFPGEEVPIRYRQVYNLSGWTDQAFRQHAIWALVLAHGRPGEHNRREIESNLGLIRKMPAWTLLQDDDQAASLEEYIRTRQQNDPQEMERQLATLGFVTEFARNHEDYLAGLSVEQLVTNSARSLLNIKNKTGVDLRLAANPEVLEILEKNRAQLRTLGWEQIFENRFYRKQDRENLIRKPHMQVSFVSQTAGMLHSLFGLYHHPLRMQLSEVLLRTGKTPEW